MEFKLMKLAFDNSVNMLKLIENDIYTCFQKLLTLVELSSPPPCKLSY